MEDLKATFKRYIEGTATGKERKQIQKLAKEGKLKDLIDQDVTKMIDRVSRDLSQFEIREVLDHIFADDEKVIPITRSTRSWLPAWVAAAVILIATTVGLLLYRADYLNRSFHENAISVSGANYIQLPDGSTAMLDAGSTITYAKEFGTREVTLQGKAYFDIAHDPQKPFVVHTGKVITTVLGTAFNIDAQHAAVIVTVTRGKVAVGDGDKVYDMLTPDEQLTVNTSDYTFEKKNVKAEEMIAWKSHYLILDRVTLEQAAKLVSERFNVTVEIENNEIKQCEISVWFLNNEDLDAVMAMLSELRQATYTINGNNVAVKGGTACD